MLTKRPLASRPRWTAVSAEQRARAALGPGMFLVAMVLFGCVGCSDDEQDGAGGSGATGTGSGGSGATSSGGTGTGGTGTGGTGTAGTGTGTGGSGGSGPETCRRYLTQAGLSYLGGTGSVTASFDEPSATYTMQLSVGAEVFLTVTTGYASVDDFITEAQTVGRILYRTETFAGIVNATATYSYDAEQRLVGKATDHADSIDSTETYTAWDAQGRPTQGDSDAEPAQADCLDVPLAFTYDDPGRRRTKVTSFSQGTGTDCPGEDTSSWERFDEDGNVVEQYHHGDTEPMQITVEQSETVCR